MSQVTEERFEEILTAKLAPLTTKQDVRDAVEELVRITNTGFEDVLECRDVRERVFKLESAVHAIKEALHVSA